MSLFKIPYIYINIYRRNSHVENSNASQASKMLLKKFLKYIFGRLLGPEVNSPMILGKKWKISAILDILIYGQRLFL